MLTELETQNRKAAMDKFVSAVWEGQEPAKLLALAGTAGLSGYEADAVIDRISQAREQMAHANQLPRLRKEAAEAQERLDKVHARATAKIARLEAQIDEASYAASDTRKALFAAEDSARKLLALHDEGLLLAEMPKDVAHLIARRQAEVNSDAVHMAMSTALNERNRRRAIVQNIEQRLAHMPILAPLDQRHHENLLRDRLKDAQDELAKAGAAYKKAEAAAEGARKAIPSSL
jgi:hypothetical protein